MGLQAEDLALDSVEVWSEVEQGERENEWEVQRQTPLLEPKMTNIKKVGNLLAFTFYIVDHEVHKWNWELICRDPSWDTWSF